MRVNWRTFVSACAVYATYQQENFAIWFDFVFLHVFDQAAVCIAVRNKEGGWGRRGSAQFMVVEIDLASIRHL